MSTSDVSTSRRRLRRIGRSGLADPGRIQGAGRRHAVTQRRDVQGDLDDYLGVAETAIAHIAHAMALTGRTDCRRILDLPCGHGRVLRALRAVFSDAELIACDINRDGVDFCAAQFGALPVYSTPNPREIPLDHSLVLALAAAP